MATITSVDLQKYLAGLNFPANKQAIIQFAKTKGASPEVVSALNGLPNREYTDNADVADELDA